MVRDLCRRFWRFLPPFFAAIAPRDPLLFALAKGLWLARATPVVGRRQPTRATPNGSADIPHCPPRTLSWLLSSLPQKDPKTGTPSASVFIAALNPPWPPFTQSEKFAVSCLPGATSFRWACFFACPTLYSVILIVAFAILVYYFLCSQLFALPFTNSLQLMNHHFTLLIFLVRAQPHTREADATLNTRQTPLPPLLVDLSGELVIFDTDSWKYEGSTYGRESIGVFRRALREATSAAA